MGKSAKIGQALKSGKRFWKQMCPPDDLADPEIKELVLKSSEFSAQKKPFLWFISHGSEKNNPLESGSRELSSVLRSLNSTMK
jgi:hypothetical protein